MRRMLVLLVVFLIMKPVYSDAITEQDASVVARTFLAERKTKTRQEISVEQITPITREGVVVGYALDLTPTGFILVPGVTEMSPIKAYFPHGSFAEYINHPLLNIFESESIALQELLRNLKLSNKMGEVDSLFAREHALWIQSLNELKVHLPSTELTIASFLKAEDTDGIVKDISWGQGWPFCQRFDLIETSNPDGSSIEVWPFMGCTATALAQTFRYWEYPDQASVREEVSYRATPSDSTLSQHYPSGIPVQGTIGGSAYEWSNMSTQYTRLDPRTPFGMEPATIEEKAVGNLYKDIVLALRAGIAEGKVLTYWDYQTQKLKVDGYETPAAFYSPFGFPHAANAVVASYFGYNYPDLLKSDTISRYGSAVTHSEAVETWYWVVAKQLLRKYPVPIHFIKMDEQVPPQVIFSHALIATGMDYNSTGRYLVFNFGWRGQNDNIPYAIDALTIATRDWQAANIDVTESYSFLKLYPSIRDEANKAYISIVTRPFKPEVLPRIQVDNQYVMTDYLGSGSPTDYAVGAVEVAVAPGSTHQITFEYLSQYRMVQGSQLQRQVTAGPAGTTTFCEFDYTKPSHSISFGAVQNGIISSSGTGSYSEGQTIQVSAIPDEGYQLAHWLVNGQDYGNDNPLELVVSGDMTVSAEFEKIPSFVVESSDFETEKVKGLCSIKFFDPNQAQQQVWSTAHSGNVMFVGFDHYVSVVDVNDPENPGEIALVSGDIGRLRRIEKMLVRQNFLYVMAVGHDHTQVHIYDIGDLSNIVEAGRWTGRGVDAHDMCFSESNPDLLFVTQDHYGTYLVDISNPANPTTFGRLHPDENPNLNTKSGARARSICIVDDIALVTVDGIGLWAYDLGWFAGKDDNGVDCFKRLDAATVYFNGESEDIEVYGGLAYVTNSSEGMIVLNVSDARHPADLGSGTVGSVPLEMEISGNKVWTTRESGGLALISLYNWDNIHVVDHDPLPGSTSSISKEDDLLAVGSTQDGKLYLYQLKDESRESPFHLTINSPMNEDWEDWCMEVDYWLVNKDTSDSNPVRLFAMDEDGKYVVADVIECPGKGKVKLPLSQFIQSGVVGIQVESESPALLYADITGYRRAMSAYMDKHVSGSSVFASHIPTQTSYWDTYAMVSRDGLTSGLNPWQIMIDGTTITPDSPDNYDTLNLEDYFPASVTTEADAFARLYRMGTGFEMFCKNNSDGAAVELIDSTSRTLYVPHIPEERDQFWSGLALLRPYSGSVSATFDFYNAEGGLVYSGSLTIPGQSKIVDVFEGFFPGLPDDAGWCKISASSGIMGIEVYGTTTGICGFSLPTRGYNNSTLPMVTDSSTSDWTGFAITNPNSHAANVTIELVDESGHVDASVSQSVSAHQKFKAVLTDLFPNISIEESHYVRLRANRSVLAVVVCGANHNTWMKALPARYSY